MNQPTGKRQLTIAVVSDIRHNPFIKAMHDVGLLPVNCHRFVIDSGPPDGVMTIRFDAFLDDRIFDEPVIRSLEELKKLSEKPIAEVE